MVPTIAEIYRLQHTFKIGQFRVCGLCPWMSNILPLPSRNSPSVESGLRHVRCETVEMTTRFGFDKRIIDTPNILQMFKT